MADDIQIKGGQANNAGPQPSNGGNSAGSQDGAPVIDLRELDRKPAASGAQTSGTSSSTNPQSDPKKTVNSKAIDLGTPDDGQFVTLGNQRYAIPALVREKFPDLIQLIKETESMNDEEREYWYQILPIMTEDQIKKFRDILVNEKEQLSHLDEEYQTELNKLNEKHMIEWKEFETKEKRKALTHAEQQAKVQEKSEEEALLQRLSQV